jgi:dTDP-4-dehydrorhamnose reductase
MVHQMDEIEFKAMLCGAMAYKLLNLVVARILILGSTGMLGHQITELLENTTHDVFVTLRNKEKCDNRQKFYFDANKGAKESLENLIAAVSPEYIINCIGVIKQVVDESKIEDRLKLIKVNAELPHILASVASNSSIRIIQIATDCVFNGQDGDYSERSEHNAADLYGITKSIGEIDSSNFLNLRCSIIGPEIVSKTSLLSWVLSQEKGAVISGYLDHIWNGITTLAFSKIVLGIINNGTWKSGTWHVVPADQLTKCQLVMLIAEKFNRKDLTVSPVITSRPVNRTLMTINPQNSAELWAGGGYSKIPKIDFLIDELRLAWKGPQ